MTKTCSICKVAKSLDNYYIRQRRLGPEPINQCKRCWQDIQNKYRKTDRGKEVMKEQQERRKGARWNYHVGHRYGITNDQFESMMGSQSERCAICDGQETYEHNRLCIDHDHETKEVRGLLCTRCNKALGGFFDNPDLLQKAMQYLVNYRTMPAWQAVRAEMAIKEQDA